MNVFDKIFFVFKFQLLFAAALGGSAWLVWKYTDLKTRIPQNFLQEHKSRLKPLPILLVVTCVVFSYATNFFGRPSWFNLVMGLGTLLIGLCYLLRSILTLKSGNALPGALKHLVVLEMIFALTLIVLLGAVYL